MNDRPGRALSAAGALILDPAGRVLLVEPTYKDGWEIPGGVIEPGETPSQACARELTEELGLTVRSGRLLVVDLGAAAGPGGQGAVRVRRRAVDRRAARRDRPAAG